MRPVRQRRLRLTIGYPGTACAGSVEEVGAGSRIRTYEARSAADLQSAAINHSAIPAFWTRRSAAWRSPDLDASLGRFALAPGWMRRSTALQPILSDCCSAASRSLLACSVGSFRSGAREGTRTPNLPITNRLRCQLRHPGSGFTPKRLTQKRSAEADRYSVCRFKCEEGRVRESQLDRPRRRRFALRFYREMSSHSHWPAKMPAPIAATCTATQ